ncbi:hypothetical protein HSEST_0952 [Halapricum desulfuricans]|uniref:Uncharacterized protein n=1 Tax=Halapricum desulfuricans TaxID=2841257 RepID=A0A897NNZ5_9EURY|nr:hypothetical protein HSEST_0952 [Halapricum desulfuricans]
MNAPDNCHVSVVSGTEYFLCWRNVSSEHSRYYPVQAKIPHDRNHHTSAFI